MDEFHVSSQISNEPLLHQLKAVFTFSGFSKILFFTFVYIGVGYMPSVFMPAYGAEFYGGCMHGDDDDCTFNYTEYQFYQSLFLSIRGLISLLFAGFIGRASDAYGRKMFLIMNVVLSFLCYVPLLFVFNFWFYFALYLIMGLNGSNNSATPVMAAYISDILPPHLRTVGYGSLYIMAGIGLFVGAGSAIIIDVYLGTFWNLMIVTICAILMTIGVYLYVPESLDAANRKQMNITHYNPFRPLFHIRENPVVLWISVVQFAISLPETGVLDTMIIYVLDQLNIQSESSSAEISALIIGVCGIGMILSNVFLLPFLKKHFTDYHIILLSAIFLVTSMLLFALVSIIKHLIIVSLGCLMITSGMIAFPAANSIVTRHASKTEQGIAFGIVYAMRGITFMIAPFSFGYGYNLCKYMGVPWLIYVIAGILCSLVIPCVMGPLKKTLKDTKKYHRKYNFSISNLHNVEQLQMNSSSDSDINMMDQTNTNSMDNDNNDGNNNNNNNATSKSNIMYEMVSIRESMSQTEEENDDNTDAAPSDGL